MTNLIIFLWCAFLVAVVTALIYYSKHRGSCYSFQNYSTVDIPYISIDIQGITFNMIVDISFLQ